MEVAPVSDMASNVELKMLRFTVALQDMKRAE